MRAIALFILACALAACGQRDDKGDSASDFAQRVGVGKIVDPAAATPGVTSGVKAAPPPHGNVFMPEKLGNISALDLGPRAGGCTFSVQGKELLVAAGAADRMLPGKAAVRIGGMLLLLDAPPGGYDAVKTGTSFTGQGYTVRIAPTGAGKANMTITNTAGRSETLAGDYACS